MKQGNILANQVPEVTVEELFLAQGIDISKRPPRPKLLQINQQMLKKAAALVQPGAIWREAAIAGFSGEQVQLAEGPTLTSQLLTRVTQGADKLILFTVTIGAALDDEIGRLLESEDVLGAYTLNAAGAAYMTKCVDQVVKELEDRYRQAGESLTFTLSPGNAYWSGLEDVGKIVGYLGADQIGVTISESGVMKPPKSIALVMGAGTGLADLEGKETCDFCSLAEACKVKNTREKC